MRRGRHRHIPTGKRLTKHCYVLCFTHTAAQNADIYSVLKQTPFLGVALSGTATVKILKNSGVSSFEPDFLYFFRCMINVKHKLEFKVRRRPKPSQNAVKHSNSKTTMRFTYVNDPLPVQADLVSTSRKKRRFAPSSARTCLRFVRFRFGCRMKAMQERTLFGKLVQRLEARGSRWQMRRVLWDFDAFWHVCCLPFDIETGGNW